MNVNIDDLMEKFLLLENVDYKLSTNERMVTEMVDHRDKQRTIKIRLQDRELQQCTLTFQTRNCA